MIKPLVASALALVLGAGCGALLGAVAAAREGGSTAGNLALAALKSAFQRPAALPRSADPPNAARIALGEKLFRDPSLSGTGTISCVSCHDPALAFTDGAAIGRGAAKTPLARHTPHLWNLAWGETFFWDGRAKSLEDQVRGPFESPAEMAGSLQASAERLARDPVYAPLFRQAFPDEDGVTPSAIARAIAAFERGLVSPQTRFDRWIAGQTDALSAREAAGFTLFTGKAGCASCHSGWAFTDRAFHDIGLPGTDLGRGPVIGLPAANHAFRTPSLRELAWTAPYMHDGALPTLDAVLDHYDHGARRRPTLSPDMPRLRLSEKEREALLAFLATLSSEDPPTRAPSAESAEPALAAPVARFDAEAEPRVSQRDKTFRPGRVALRSGQDLIVRNDDTRTHNVRMDIGANAFNSGAQEPGQSVRLAFPEPGTYRVYCGIHPAMTLDIEVR